MLDDPSRVTGDRADGEITRSGTPANSGAPGAPAPSDSGPDPHTAFPGEFDATIAIDARGAPSAAAPPRIGGYRILRVVGQGGMGTVYEAEQDKPRRNVALKVIRPGLAGPSLLRRFEQESLVLGRLQHPGIAQVYEAGTADEGYGVQPYFAMEFVRGRTLDAYADEKHLDVRARLDLMARICDAVEHAHQKGVIHRDLKPGNILVDETGQPKILDFGVARMTDADVQLTMNTDMGTIVGTLPYMSPEQVLGDPAELDTRSDVYTLGVILYEVLAGRLPYEIRKKPVTEGMFIIREQEPDRLGVVSRSFRGDIETIAAKALSKEKERRYQSASELGADIRRYLKDEPIMALPPTTGYQLRKFARRNRPLVIGLGATFIALVAGVAFSSWQAVRAKRAEGLSRSETEKAQAVNDFLQTMLSSVDPSALKGRDMTVRLTLDEAQRKLAAGALRGQPLIEASVRTTLGKTYQALGLYAEAEPDLRKALDLRKSLLGPEDPDVAASLNNLASLLHDRGDLAEAEPLYREAIRVRRKVLGPGHKDVGASLNDLGLLLKQRGDLAPAESLYRESLAIQQRALGEENPEVAQGMNNLALLLQARGDLAGADTLLRQSLRIRRKVLGSDHPDVAQGLSNLAALLQTRGDLAGAEPLYRESLAIRRKLLGDEHPDLAVTLNNLASVLRMRGDLAGSEPLNREAIAIWRKTLGNDHPNVAAAVSNLGLLLEDRGDLAGAETLQREALAIRVRVFGQDHLQAARSMQSLGAVLVEKGDLVAGEDLLRRSLAIRIRDLPARHLDIASNEASLATGLIRRRQYAEAESLLEDARSIREEKLASGHWAILDTQSMLGETLAGRAKFEQAESLLLPAYEGLRHNESAPPARRRAARGRIERLYRAWGDPARAAAWQATLAGTR